jgi:hypothetical protein
MSLYNTFSFFSVETFHFYNMLVVRRSSAKYGRKQGRRGRSHEEQWEGQELDNRMCCRHIKSEPRTQTFRFHGHPSPLSVTEWVKLGPHWNQTQFQSGSRGRHSSPEKNDFVVLFGLFSCVRTQVHISSCDMKTSPGSFETPSCFRDVHVFHQVASSGRS